VLSYRVRLDIPVPLIRFVSRLLAARRRELGTRRGARKLGCRQQAVFGLAWFRDRCSIARLGAGFGISQATAYRYVGEVIDVLAAKAPGLREALERALADGVPHVILDGKVFDSDRCLEKTLSRRGGKEIDLWYSGKKHGFGGNVQALFYPDGRPFWVSGVVPGNVNDLSSAREMVTPVLSAFTGKLPVLADAGYEKAGHGILTPARKPQGALELDINSRTRNALIRSVRCKGERGFALLTQRWTTLQHITASPSRIGDITRAALVLTLFEHKMLT